MLGPSGPGKTCGPTVRGQEKKTANHKFFWLAGEREKPQAQEQIRTARQGRSGECKKQEREVEE